MLKFLEGKKTYLVMLLVFVYGGLQALSIEVPDWVFPALAAAGLGAVGAKIDRAAK